jgi:hypothetical protein
VFYRDPAALTLQATGAPPPSPMPVEARVLRARGDAVRVVGGGGTAFALSNCEISGAGRDGLVVEAGDGAVPVTMAGCNVVANGAFAVRNPRGAAVPLAARGNWWGDPAGAPTAGGNAVSAGVDASSPAPAAFELGY